MRVLITGCSGFVGSALTPSLVEAGHLVRAASRDETGFSKLSGVEWRRLPELTRPVDWSGLLDGIDAVVHLAAIAHRSGPDLDVYNRVNYEATAELAQACKLRAIHRLIFMSSIAAQAGAASDQIVRETDAPRPATAYDRTKLAAEAAVRDSGVPYTILRPVLVYGPGAKGNVARLVRIAALPLPVPFGAFRNRRSMLAIDNLVEAVAFCLACPGTTDRTFIVADPEPITPPEMIRVLREAMGRSPKLLPIPPLLIRAILKAAGREMIWDRIGRDLVASAAELSSLGWRPRVHTRDGLSAMIHSRQPAAEQRLV